MTGLTLGKAAVIALLKRYVQWRVAWKWCAAAIVLEPLLIVAGVYIGAVLTGVRLDFTTVMAYKLFGTSANLVLFVLPFFLVEIITNGKEMGAARSLPLWISGPTRVNCIITSSSPRRMKWRSSNTGRPLP